MKSVTAQYELAVLGQPTDALLLEFTEKVAVAIAPFKLKLGQEVSWHIKPDRFQPDQRRAAAAVFFGARGIRADSAGDVLALGIPVLPVASSLMNVGSEIPPELRRLNCLGLQDAGINRVVTALLECAGLLPKQRRVFVSYKRDEARQAALQLFDEFSARHFDVFLDTHGIAPAEDFQAMLWHRLCDSDVLVMLDTPNYFNSRWTSAEFGRALAKNIAVLRVGWPDFSPARQTQTVSRADLSANEIDDATGRLTQVAVDRICLQLEAVRSQSHAVRNINLVGSVRFAVEKIGGRIDGVGAGKAIFARLPDDREIVVYPTIGVPTAQTLQDAMENTPSSPIAVVYDHVGLHPKWQSHMEWLGTHIRGARWVRACETAWDLADWEVRT